MSKLIYKSCLQGGEWHNQQLSSYREIKERTSPTAANSTLWSSMELLPWKIGGSKKTRWKTRSTNIRSEIIGSICSWSKELLFEAVVPCLRGVYMGTPEALFVPVAGSKEKELIARRMSRATTAWWCKLWSSKYTQGMVESLTDSFDIDDCLLASEATFDTSAMIVESEFVARADFAD